MQDRFAVPLHQLRRNWDPEAFAFATTDPVPELDGLIGQERAVSALHFGLSLRSPGYHIFVAGPSGTGKTSYSRSVVEAHAAPQPSPQDWVYVHNFDRPDEPIALALAPGGAPAFAREMDELVQDCRKAAERALATREHQSRREELVRSGRMQVAQVMAQLESIARDSGFALSQTPHGVVPVPVVEGQPMTEEQFSGMSQAARLEISERGHRLREIIAEATRQAWELEKQVRESLAQLDTEVASAAVTPIVDKLRATYADRPKVVQWLNRVARELVGHALPSAGTAADETAAALMEAEAGTEEDEEVEEAPPPRRRIDPFERFRVNVFVHQSKATGAPVVYESNPTYFNLFGKAELVPTPDGNTSSGVLDLKAGALQRANGGYLIVQAADLLRAPAAWEALKRALTTREVRVEVPDQENRIFSVVMIRPQPIPLDVKVILIGSAGIYRALYTQDEGFRKLFKIKAEFDDAMPANEANLRGYARFIRQLCQREGLRHLTAAAMAQVVEHSHRLAEDQTKLSARFNEVIEVIYEANAWAEAEGSPEVDAAHIERAIAEKKARASLPEERMVEMIERGTIMVDVDGAVVGQVNGLTVMSLGDYSFGSPSRITARVYTGSKGILHIEREIDMTGQIHDKGLYTLTGFLGDRFAQDKPLNFSASIAFEQTYVPVDGDSASSTELYALLSALADLPIDQGIAVTGSVNQRGQVQPIGGVNEKIEGFYRVCKLLGLTGRQGVMIPRQNLPNLMLSEEVVAAVANGQFHVWAVSSIEEGIEMLTGVPAGTRGPDGKYTPGSVFDRVDRRIEALVRNLANWHLAD